MWQSRHSEVMSISSQNKPMDCPLCRGLSVLAQATCCFRAMWEVVVCPGFQCCFFFFPLLLLRKMTHYPSQRMAVSGRSNRMVQVLKGPRPSLEKWPAARGGISRANPVRKVAAIQAIHRSQLPPTPQRRFGGWRVPFPHWGEEPTCEGSWLRL